jgi:ElaB/YqjD/DUF883 family membrane-anchored ribosome-binding protein
MRKALTVAARYVDPTPILTVAIAGEVGFAIALLAAGRVPAALLHALQLFLRF